MQYSQNNSRPKRSNCEESSPLCRTLNRPRICKQPGKNNFWDPINRCSAYTDKDGKILKRLIIFIDNSYIFLGSRELGIHLDHRRLVDFLSNRAFECFDLKSAHIYCVIDPTATQEKIIQTRKIYELFGSFPLFDVKIFNLRTKQKFWDGPLVKYEKGVDVALTADLLLMASQDRFDTAILCIGDEVYSPAVEYAQELGKTVYIAGFDHDYAPNLSEVADGIVPLSENVDEIQQIVRSTSVRSSQLRDSLDSGCHKKIPAQRSPQYWSKSPVVM